MALGGVFFFVAGFALGGACGYAVPALVRAWRSARRYRGQRLVSCPESYAPAAVTVDTWAAACAASRGVDDIHLRSCSRWPVLSLANEDRLSGSHWTKSCARSSS